ncbi:hypothetical protein V3M78_06865 [Trueperella pyogenes]|uniref:DUF4190 domain-containing protein n=1 Tax=Trueperella pyogenes TaxID=1661 RepID=X4RBT6_9ACTO|nr:hypothetical protein [Trueperella pyogenes]AHU89250.1 hypothetical protein CQ11_03810 [Trueperella pyogenes]ALD74025.1 hypothetical protein AN946_06550 [Trueperella pyogenes]AWA43200.1 hypothetical protein DBV13_03775 [Trueperella pyogenes]AWG04401.1 hypothetical protein DC090_08145 [Trueperella pyogenes]AWG17128.1 hypothetical protein DDE06_10075 [Trueperella pyogenes]
MLIVNAAIYGVCGLAAMTGNGLIRAFLRKIDCTIKPAHPTLLDVQRSLPGGRWIGILERLATYVCIVSGFAGGIGVVLAVKGLGRYPELRNDSSARVGELFIIGTFASMLWAAAWAGIAFAGTYAVARI